MTDFYAQAGVDTGAADRGVRALVDVLQTICIPGSSRVVPLPGHYASVIKITDNLGIAIATDGVGSKLLVAEATEKLDTVGIDCIAMNVNDLICVGAKPVALVDYLAVEHIDELALVAIAQGLKVGAELAEIEIPGGEVAVLPELIRGHPSPNGFDLCASAIGVVELDQIIDGSTISTGDALIGIPASGLHSNGYTLARKVLFEKAGFSLTDTPSELAGRTVAQALLEPTTIYVKAIKALLQSQVEVHGLAHITGGGVENLLRLNQSVGFDIQNPLPVPSIFDMVCKAGNISKEEAWRVFNMGCGFVCVVPASHAKETQKLLAAHHPGVKQIGVITDEAGVVKVQ